MARGAEQLGLLGWAVCAALGAAGAWCCAGFADGAARGVTGFEFVPHLLGFLLTGLSCALVAAHLFPRRSSVWLAASGVSASGVMCLPVGAGPGLRGQGCAACFSGEGPRVWFSLFFALGTLPLCVAVAALALCGLVGRGGGRIAATLWAVYGLSGALIPLLVLAVRLGLDAARWSDSAVGLVLGVASLVNFAALALVCVFPDVDCPRPGASVAERTSRLVAGMALSLRVAEQDSARASEHGQEGGAR